ncbi:hypothetical protein Vau01_076190 [Virgisporangium aurantiacum]|uniref:Uncharacterized protein n=2 Tax=Virgisporangium aurantiacum TaxID=175570 RepID=A0A8J4E3M5_9ACTN|nr:hypothetical protein Vau01_076190 [Virgisporangium aurantiacum]
MQRAAAIAGLALMTGGLFGVTATAASAAPTQESTAATSTENDRRGGGDWDDRGGRDWGRDWGRRDRNYVVDRFDTRRECRWRGWIGENRGRWENPRCYRVGGDWLLVVERSHRRWH